MEKSWIWLHFGEYISFRGTCSLGQSCFNPCVTWPDDYAISHNYCIWSCLLFPAQNCYLEISIFRRSDFIISLCNLLFVLCLWKSGAHLGVGRGGVLPCLNFWLELCALFLLKMSYFLPYFDLICALFPWNHNSKMVIWNDLEGILFKIFPTAPTMVVGLKILYSLSLP